MVDVPKGVTLSSEADAERLVRALELAKDLEDLEYDTEAIVAVCDFYVAHGGSAPAPDVDVDALARNGEIRDAIDMALEEPGVDSREDALAHVSRAYTGRL